MPTRSRMLLCAVMMGSLALLLACNRKNTTAAESASASDAGSPWRMELKTSPDHPSMAKPVTFLLHISDQQGRPVENAQVSGALTMKEMDMGVTELKFAPKGSGGYEASTKELDMSGAWSLAVDAAQGSRRAKKAFDVTVGD